MQPRAVGLMGDATMIAHKHEHAVEPEDLLPSYC